MDGVQQSRNVSRSYRIGRRLIVLALISVVVAYPPSATGVNPLFGVESLFLPILVSAVAILTAIVGGAFITQGLMNNQTKRSQRLIFSILIAFSAAAVVCIYLVVVAGFGLKSPFILAAMAIAVVGGIVNGFLD